MAGAFLAGLAGDMLTGGVGSLISAGANAINQKIEFGFNSQLQQNSFTHDKEMLAAQVAATKQLQRDMINIRRDILMEGGFTPTDAARGAVGAQMTQLVDWNGSRFAAPGASVTSSKAGVFTHQIRPGVTLAQTPRRQVEAKPPPKPTPQATPAPTVLKPSDMFSMTSGSWGQPQASNSTKSTALSSTSSESGTISRATRRTREWVEEQSARTPSPYMDGALRTAFVTPPTSSASSSAGTVSTVPKELLDSWTPAFNLQRQPYFAHLRRRGQSQA